MSCFFDALAKQGLEVVIQLQGLQTLPHFAGFQGRDRSPIKLTTNTKV
jgi:hypothetical protein